MIHRRKADIYLYETVTDISSSYLMAEAMRGPPPLVRPPVWAHLCVWVHLKCTHSSPHTVCMFSPNSSLRRPPPSSPPSLQLSVSLSTRHCSTQCLSTMLPSIVLRVWNHCVMASLQQQEVWEDLRKQQVSCHTNRNVILFFKWLGFSRCVGVLDHHWQSIRLHRSVIQLQFSHQISIH